ncbi:MAG: hypothetical protein KAV82_15600 [Phycisphaerae bacterium]|nr:hypothetical protein [Phycisphaerae bacterium]
MFQRVHIITLIVVGGFLAAGARSGYGYCEGNEFAKLLSSNGVDDERVGQSVDIDGNIAVVGSWPIGADPALPGAAYVFWHDGSGWVQAATLQASDGEPDDYFGASVAIDGYTIVVGAYGHFDAEGHAGAAYVFEYVEGSWVEQAKLTADETGPGDFGISVAKSGTVVVVGASWDDDNGWESGSAYVFRYDYGSSSWVQQDKLLASDGDEGDWFGYSVGISGDAIVVGAHGNDDDGACSGSAYVFRRDEQGTPSDPSDDVWPQEQKLLADDAMEEDYFGFSVAIDDDAIIIGAYGAIESYLGKESGVAYIFRHQDPLWFQEHRLGPGPFGSDYDGFGVSVDIAGDTVVAGACWDDDGFGSAYVFRHDTGCCSSQSAYWCFGTRLRASDGWGRFGLNVGVSEKYAVIGAPGNWENGYLAGAAYLFHGISDCNNNCRWDLCDIVAGTSGDCNENGFADECDTAVGTSPDCNENSTPDECEPDCNNNGTPDDCDVWYGTSQDCNGNVVPDECDVAAGTSPDCDGDRVPDECSSDSNTNGTPDVCELLKWSQLPTEDEPFLFYGWNEPSIYEGEQIVADDWYCTDDRPITAIRWWGSYTNNNTNGWIGDEAPPWPSALEAFHIAIWSDQPAGGPEEWSRPDTVLREWTVSADEVNERPVGTDVHPEHSRETCFVYDFLIPQGYEFQQEPDTQSVYWLSISAIPATFRRDDCPCNGNVMNFGPSANKVDAADVNYVMSHFGCPVGFGDPNCDACDVNCDGVVDFADVEVVECQMGTWPPDPTCCVPPYRWGWKTRQPHWNDDAVRITSPTDPVFGSTFSEGLPIENGEGSWDMAFALLSDVMAPPQACCPEDEVCRDVSPWECVHTYDGEPQGAGTDCTFIWCGTVVDCNSNGIHDGLDIANGVSQDCNTNAIPDECDIADETSTDCNWNDIPDECDIDAGTSQDCNTNNVPDECEGELASSRFLADEEGWSAHIGVQVWWEPSSGNPNGYLRTRDNDPYSGGQIWAPAEYHGDWSGLDGIGFVRFDMRFITDPDGYPVVGQPYIVIEGPGGKASYFFDALPTTEWRTYEVPIDGSLWSLDEGPSWAGLLLDVQKLLLGADFTTGGRDENGFDNVYVGCPPVDCNGNGVLDECDIAEETSSDINVNQIPDECEDCNTNSLPDECDLDCTAAGGYCDVAGCGLSLDCNTNAILDECDIAAATSEDINLNGVPDECECCVAPPGDGDINTDGYIDLDDYAAMVPCMTGAGQLAEPECKPFDMDGDCDVDLDDFGLFQQAFTGPPPPEACCLPDGSCIDVAPDDCVSQGGVPQGPDTDCQSIPPCPQPQACCYYPEGVCQDELPDNCSTNGGVPQGEGTDCLSIQCPEACCLPDGNCIDIAPDDCTSQDGTPQGPGTDCLSIPLCPQPQACCYYPEGVCQDELPDNCSTNGGVPQGEGTDCLSIQCPEACCLPDGNCIDIAPDDCTSQDGTPQGPGTDCLSIPPCPSPVACCYPDGSCEDKTPDYCSSNGGYPREEGTECYNLDPPCPVLPQIVQVRSLGEHEFIGELGIPIELDLELPTPLVVEPRTDRIHLIEVTFSVPMDEASCEDPANVAITGDGEVIPPDVSSCGLEVGGTVLRIVLSEAADNQHCYDFDLTGMLSAELAPLANATFTIVALIGDVNSDLTVNHLDLAAVQDPAHWGQPPSEEEGTVRLDCNMDGLIGAGDIAVINSHWETSVDCLD